MPRGITLLRASCRAVLPFLLVLIAVPAHAAGRQVTFHAEDGTTLAGTWYEASTRPAAAVILVHMLGRNRHDWDGVAAALAAQGIGALTFDLRGHGDSQGTRPSDETMAVFVQDLAAARRYVASRGDVSPARIAFAGASLGANLAVLQAAQAPGIAGLVLLSPSTDYRGLRIDGAFRKYAGRALLVSSDDDPYSQRSVRELTKAAGGAGSLRETMTLSHAGHGTVMLSRDADLTRAVVDWLRRTLQ